METGRLVVHDGKMESGVESETGSYGQKRSFWLMELTVSKSAFAVCHGIFAERLFSSRQQPAVNGHPMV
jgi:hypothetical protein